MPNSRRSIGDQMRQQMANTIARHTSASTKRCLLGNWGPTDMARSLPRDVVPGGDLLLSVLLDLVQEDRDHLGIELHPAAALQLGDGDVVRQRLPVRSIRGHRVVGV